MIRGLVLWALLTVAIRGVWRELTAIWQDDDDSSRWWV